MVIESTSADFQAKLTAIFVNQVVFVKHHMYAPGGNKAQKAIFIFKVKVKVTRLLTLMSFERASSVEYVYQIWSLYLLRFKIYSEGYIWQQTDKQTNRLTGQKQYTLDHSIRGIKISKFAFSLKIYRKVKFLTEKLLKK